MKVVITGICGFVGKQIATALQERIHGVEIAGVDNLSRPGSEGNRSELGRRGIRVVHGDIRMRSDLDALLSADWVLDAAANPSVLAGVDGKASSRQLAEHNLNGTLNILEYCRERGAGLVLLSTNRVYSVRDLSALRVHEEAKAFTFDGADVPGVSSAGVAENFSTRAPLSLYGATKLASETMAVEYGLAFGFPVCVNRCGVLAGAGQFGTAEQGIFSYWLHAHAARLPLRYIGFGGHGYQVRDAFHPDDLANLIAMQIRGDVAADPIYNVGGGAENAMSLAQLTDWCNAEFGEHIPQPDLRPRAFDIPWIVMDSARARQQFGWKPARRLESILQEIAAHVRANPDWLSRSGAV